MKPRATLVIRFLLLMVALAAAALTTGCNTPEPGNQSSRPWNSPKSWEGGVPGMLYDRR
jgi:predicted small secreted protein